MNLAAFTLVGVQVLLRGVGMVWAVEPPQMMNVITTRKSNLQARSKSLRFRLKEGVND